LHTSQLLLLSPAISTHGDTFKKEKGSKKQMQHNIAIPF
jgi:hypothetical protein